MNLIVGGTGALGSAISRQLLAEGERVRVMTRSPARAADLAEAGAEVVEGDLLDRGSLERACEGARTVVAAAHSLFGRGREASQHVDGEGHRALIDVAGAADVRRFVYTSMYDFDPAYHDLPFFRIKLETEEYLKSSGLSYTILRPTAFMESHAHALIGQPLAAKGKVVLFGRGDRPRNFVAADEVAEIAVRALRDPSLEGATIAIGGPDHHTTMDVVRLYERATGRKAKVVHVPVSLLRAFSLLLRPLHPGLSQVMQMGILADAVDQRFDPQTVDPPLADPRTSLEDWVSKRVAQTAAAT